MKSQDPTIPSDSQIETPEPEVTDDGRVGRVPVAVSVGDFSTPSQRKRTITRPRGLRALEPTTPGVEAAVQTGALVPSVGAPSLSAQESVDATALSVPSDRGLSPVDEFLASPPTPIPQLESTPLPYATGSSEPTPWPEVLPLTPPPDTSDAAPEIVRPAEAVLPHDDGGFGAAEVLTPPPVEGVDPTGLEFHSAPPTEGWEQTVDGDSTSWKPSSPLEDGRATEMDDATVSSTDFVETTRPSEAEIESAVDGSAVFGSVAEPLFEPEPSPRAVVATPASGRPVASPPPIPIAATKRDESLPRVDGSRPAAGESAGSMPVVENAAAGAEMRLATLAGPNPGAARESDRLARDEALVDDLLRRATEQMTNSPGLQSDPGDRLAPSSPQRIPEDLPPAPIEQAQESPGRIDGEIPIDTDSPIVSEVTLSPLAQTLANMAESMHAEPVLDPSFDIDIIDAPLVPPTRQRSHSPAAVPPPVPSDSQLPVPPADQRLPEALADRPRRPRRSKPWYEEVFDENYLRTLPFMTPEQTLREVDFIETSLAAPKGSAILDIGCGYGRHAIELVQRGLSVTGLDLSLPLLLRAADESQKRALSVNFVHSDMRGMAFDQEFDGAYCMLSSFGYFDEESNLKVAEGIARALKPGARFLLDVVNRDYIVGDLPARIWWEGDGCVVLEEVEFNFNTSRILTHRSVVFEDGRQLDQEISVRAYSLHELGKLLRQTGLRIIEVSGSLYTPGRFFGAASRNLIVLAERRRD